MINEFRNLAHLGMCCAIFGSKVRSKVTTKHTAA